jgi:hypothetical protein
MHRLGPAVQLLRGLAALSRMIDSVSRLQRREPRKMPRPIFSVYLLALLALLTLLVPVAARSSAAAAMATDARQNVLDVEKREFQPTSVSQRVVRYATLVGIPIFTLIYGQEVWDWGKDHGWRWGHEGWFGRSTPHGGADKLGHAYAHYLLTRVSSRIFHYTESGSSRRILFAGLLAAAIGTGIEVGDAFNGAYGFSPQDLAADFFGIGLALLLETVPAADDLLGVSAHYWPTRGFLGHPKRSWLEFEGDTGGWTYLLNLKPRGLGHLGLPRAATLRFFTLDVGYYTRGFTAYDAATGITAKIRSWFAGVSLSIPDVIDAVLGRRHLASRIVHETFSYVHLPIGVTTAVDID